MNDLVLLDFNNFSLERFAKVQGILQPTEKNIPPKARTTSNMQSRRTKPIIPTVKAKDSTDRIEFARKVVNSTLSTLDLWKADQKEPTKAKIPPSKKYVYESASLAFRALYEKNSESHDSFDVEKRHISFVLKLIDVQMVNQAIRELETLAKSILTRLNALPDTHSNLPSRLLLIPIPLNPSESLVDVVILSQIALLKAISKYAKNQVKPIESAVSFNFFQYFNCSC